MFYLILSDYVILSWHSGSKPCFHSRLPAAKTQVTICSICSQTLTAQLAARRRPDSDQTVARWLPDSHFDLQIIF